MNTMYINLLLNAVYRNCPEICPNFLLDIHQCITHIEHFELRNYRVNNAIDANRILRIKYLMNELTDVDFKTTLQQDEKKRQKSISFHITQKYTILF